MNDNSKALILLLISHGLLFYGASIIFKTVNQSSQNYDLYLGAGLMIISLLFYGFGKHYNLKYQKEKRMREKQQKINKLQAKYEQNT